jgi:ferredoxin
MSRDFRKYIIGKPTKWGRFTWGIPLWRPFTDRWSRTTAWPVIGKLSGWILGNNHYDVTYVPINAELEAAESTVIPRQVVEEMVKKACHRVQLPLCLCRTGCRCEHFPLEIGCIFMGESAKHIDPSMGRSLTVEEALDHVQRAIDAGLILQIGKVDPDPLMLGLRDWKHFLTLCFCCPCCCIAMRNMPRWDTSIKDRMHKLEGLRIEVSDECNGCGTCVEACFAAAITVEGERAVIGADCKGCGICASRCPRKAIEISVEDGGRMLAEALRRIESFSDVT